MNKVESAQEILDYLNADLTFNDQSHELIDEIEKLRSLNIQPTTEKWTQLSARRVLSSNTLSGHKKLESWQQANYWVGKKIQEGETFGSCHLGSLNNQLTGSGGVLRDEKIFTGDMEYLPPEYIEEALSHLYEKLNSSDNTLTKAFYAYLGIVTIHPFSNGNGRTSRLAADWVLMAQGYLPLCFDTPIQSHVAVTINYPLRDKTHSFNKFLGAILSSYKIFKHVED